MKASFKPGLTTTRTVRVDSARTVDFTDSASGATAHVYATPALVEDIEIACRELILAHADPGEDSVGARVDISHKAPSLENQQVTIIATVSKIDGRAVAFEVTAADELDEICTCAHDRFVINIERTLESLAAKAERVAG